MNKKELIKILDDWNLWNQKLNCGVLRQQYLPRIAAFIETKQVTMITGPRRAGKSFIMRQMAYELIQKMGIPKTNILIVNFDDPRFSDFSVSILEKIYEAYCEFHAPQGDIYIFLDEIQNVDKWEKWVRYMHELNKAKIVISGSNANLLSRELGTVLTGRHLDVTIFPLSFREFLEFEHIEIKNDLDLISKRMVVKNCLKKYLDFGAFPAVVLSQSKQDMLYAYFEDIVNRDLVRRFKIRKQASLRSLMRYYLSNNAVLTTYRSIGKFLKISPATVEKFSYYMEQAYLVFFLKRFSFKVKEQEKDPRKVYTVDMGLSHVIGFQFSENMGHVSENVVFLELKRRQLYEPQMELYYWKDVQHREVDFVVKIKTEITQLIQVCWNIHDHSTKDREIKSLLLAMDELHQSSGLIITEEDESEEVIKNKKIKFIPLWKWLLS